ncbi:GNAT family N-acetyltransferase [Deinococcus detaillensis]|uniref:GNAT family N-acetyltransferase n=1 Tax=Deinococcus detaillensis TaxID=2592048 RepID=A0A553ULK6_9DEIO|nr:GNAT family N-acetyltransferase [Deinococcus detaillensis]TSA81075.1 GNAT family N-acetyltransferase [Deinococcus detaillensis]
MLQPAFSLTPNVAALLTRAMFPDPERTVLTLKTYQTDPARRIFTWNICGEPVSAVGLAVNKMEAEILHIGTSPEQTARGYGRDLLHAVADHLQLQKLVAETDDESVGFYRRSGFQVSEAPARGGQRRFWCEMKLTSP